jgi:hypothetical protein
VPVNPNASDRDFMTRFTDDDSGFGWSVGAEIGAGFQIDHNVALTASLTYHYFGAVGVADNPASPNEDAVRLDDDSADELRLGVALNLRF